MANHVIFLGAGFSKSFDFPLTREFVESFEDQLLDADKKDLMTDVCNAKRTITSNGFTYDVESLIEYFQGHSHPSEYMRKSGPFCSALSRIQPISKLEPKPRSEQLKNNLEEHMIKNCYKDEITIKGKLDLSYNRLLSKVSGSSNWRTDIPDLNNHIFEIFTTNFDNSIDVYAKRFAKDKYTRGHIVGSQNQVLFRYDDLNSDYYKLKIIKLHGSVELSQLEDGKIISEIPPQAPGNSVDGMRITSKVMVYGIQKNLLQEPYLELLIKLKKSLLKVKKCTVIGYSFRDDWISKIFQEAAFQHGDFVIELIDPYATTIASRQDKLQAFIQPVDMTVEQYLETSN